MVGSLTLFSSCGSNDGQYVRLNDLKEKETMQDSIVQLDKQIEARKVTLQKLKEENKEYDKLFN